MIEKFVKIFLNMIPILVMIGLVPIVSNDFWLTAILAFIVFVSFLIKYEKKEFLIFCFGLVMMVMFEYIFVSTGVETFERDSMFGLMPIWLPVLWGYGFVAIKRSVLILDK